jgi:hypothetical protein
MKRDMDLIRLLLLQVESQNTISEIPGYSVEDVMYNANLILEADLAHGPEPLYQGDKIVSVDLDRLTWEGHDFLDAARDDTLWKKAKEKFMKPAVSWSFSVLLEWLKAEIRARALGGGA